MENCEQRKPQPQEKWIFVEEEERENKASDAVVCRCQQVPMSEMRKKQQEHEDARKMYRTETHVGRIWENEESDTGRTR